MDRDNSKFTTISLYLISSILALTIIIEAAVHITPVLAQTTGSYIEVSRIINIPKNMPNSSSLPDSNPSLPDSNPSLPDGIINGIVISPVVNSYQQVSLMFL
jgi:hypothetical protein